MYLSKRRAEHISQPPSPNPSFDRSVLSLLPCSLLPTSKTSRKTLSDLDEDPVDEGDVGEEEGGRAGVEVAVWKHPGEGVDLSRK
jgi:hypothetical protein